MQDPQIKRNSEIVLPQNVTHYLELALASLPDGNAAKVERITSGYNLANYVLLITTPSNRFIFRARQEQGSDIFESYMGAYYECAGIVDFGISFRMRTVAEEVDFMKQALAMGLPVPQIICTDNDWMLIEYIKGKSLNELVEAGEVNLVLKMLQELHFAHQKGIIYGDRWGGNEIVDKNGNIYMIDFEQEWLYEESQRSVLENLEIAGFIFNVLRLTNERDALLKIIELNALSMLDSWGYQFEVIKKFIGGFCNFYLNPNKPVFPSSLCQPSEMYTSLREPVNHLLDLLFQ